MVVLRVLGAVTVMKSPVAGVPSVFQFVPSLHELLASRLVQLRVAPCAVPAKHAATVATADTNALRQPTPVEPRRRRRAASSGISANTPSVPDSGTETAALPIADGPSPIAPSE